MALEEAWTDTVTQVEDQNKRGGKNFKEGNQGEPERNVKQRNICTIEENHDKIEEE